MGVVDHNLGTVGQRIFMTAESLCDEAFPEPELKEAAPRKKKAKGKKQSDLAKITDHREELIELSSSELDEIFGKNNYKRLIADSYKALLSFIYLLYLLGWVLFVCFNKNSGYFWLK